MKRLLAWLGFFPLVWTQDHDGEVRLRAAWQSPFGEWWCHGIGWCGHMTLLPNGGVEARRGAYVVRWKEWEHNRKHLFPEQSR